MKIKITKGGLYGAEGEIPVGTELTVKEEPKAWAGRYEVVSGGKTAVTNPANGAQPSPERLALEARCKELGITVHPQAKDETLAGKIAEAEAKAKADAEAKAKKAAE